MEMETLPTPKPGHDEFKPYEGFAALLAGDKRYLCLWNDPKFKQVLYVRINWDTGGVHNMTLNVGDSHRLYVGGSDGWYCAAYGSFPAEPCPFKARVSQLAGNCP